MKLPIFTTISLLAALAALTAGCQHESKKPRLAITGTLNYDNLVVTPGCRIEVLLDDVSRADAPATTLARQFISPRQSPPLPFTLYYEPAMIDPAHRYVVSARISCGDQLEMITDTAYPVLTQGNPSTATVVLKPVTR